MLGALEPGREMDNYALPERATPRNSLPLLAALWAAIVAASLYLAATYDRPSVVILSSDTSRFELAQNAQNALIAYGSVVAVTGPGSVFGLALPALLALAPLGIRRYRRGALLVAGALVFGICLIWPLSIGVLYLPTALLLLLAGVAR